MQLVPGSHPRTHARAAQKVQQPLRLRTSIVSKRRDNNKKASKKGLESSSLSPCRSAPFTPGKAESPAKPSPPSSDARTLSHPPALRLHRPRPDLADCHADFVRGEQRASVLLSLPFTFPAIIWTVLVRTLLVIVQFI